MDTRNRSPDTLQLIRYRTFALELGGEFSQLVLEAELSLIQFILEPGRVGPTSGWLLLLHPDFLRGQALSQKIATYGFFEYAVNEALLLSPEEQETIELLLQQMELEANRPLDNLSQEVLILHLDLLLTYCQRYINRQFLTRKPASHALLTKVELLLNQHSFNKLFKNKTN